MMNGALKTCACRLPLFQLSEPILQNLIIRNFHKTPETIFWSERCSVFFIFVFFCTRFICGTLIHCWSFLQYSNFGARFVLDFASAPSADIFLVTWWVFYQRGLLHWCIFCKLIDCIAANPSITKRTFSLSSWYNLTHFAIEVASPSKFTNEF